MAEASPSRRGSLRNQCRLLLSHEEPIADFVSGVEALSASLTSTAFNPDRIRSMLSDGGEVGKLYADDIASQLDEFAENLQHQLKSLVQQPLQAHSAAIEAAVRRARAFDEAQDAHDAAKLKYLSLTKDSPLETRAYAQQELNDRSAELALQLFDTQRGLADACASQRIAPQRALGELMVSQLAYHQSCARLLAAAMPQVSAILEEAESRRSALEEEQRADAEVRAAMPQPQLRDEATADAAEGWLQKGTFALASGHDAVKEQLNRLKPWNKRWFVLAPTASSTTTSRPRRAARRRCRSTSTCSRRSRPSMARSSSSCASRVARCASRRPIPPSVSVGWARSATTSRLTSQSVRRSPRPPRATSRPGPRHP